MLIYFITFLYIIEHIFKTYILRFLSAISVSLSFYGMFLLVYLSPGMGHILLLPGNFLLAAGHFLLCAGLCYSFEGYMILFQFNCS